MSKQSDLVSVSQGSGGDPLYIDTTNDRVGVGTTSPDSIFTVARGATSDWSAKFHRGNRTDQGIYTDGAGIALFGEDATNGLTGVSIKGANTDANNYDHIRFTTYGTERMRIDSSGNVGIGTTSPQTNLHVRQNAVSGFSANSLFDVAVIENGASGLASVLQIVAAPDAGSEIGFSDSTRNKGLISYSHPNDAMIFRTNSSERCRIDGSGNLLLGTTTIVDANGAQFVNAYAYPETGSEFRSNSTLTHSAFIFRNPNGAVGAINTSGSSTSYNTSSDYRLKENVTPLDGAADRLAQIPVHRFNFIADPDTTVDGFLAHEVQAIVPEAITGEKDAVDADGNPEYQGIDQSKLVPLLTAALQEALQKIDALEARVAALEAV